LVNIARISVAFRKSTARIKAASLKATQAITPDPTLTSGQNDKLADLGKLNGADFDRAYMDGQVDAHKDALALMRKYAEKGDVAPLKAAAAEIVSVVQKHLDRAKALKG
jgi:putative membrane protein